MRLSLAFRRGSLSINLDPSSRFRTHPLLQVLLRALADSGVKDAASYNGVCRVEGIQHRLHDVRVRE